jgi:hypothetical protein
LSLLLFDDDGKLDLTVTDDSTPSCLYRNLTEREGAANFIGTTVGLRQTGYCWRILQWDNLTVSHFFVAAKLKKLANSEFANSSVMAGDS